MRRSSYALVVGAAFCISLVAATGTQRAPAALPSATPSSGAAVFASDLGIYVANLDGTGVTRLTRDGYDADPVWSPDAKRIAFSRRVGWDGAVMVMNVDGRGLRRLGWGEGPAWSPDGTRIVFVDGPGIVDVSSGKTIAPAPAGFTIAKLEGSGTRRVGVGEVFSLTWSPDGMKIAYTVRRDDWIRLHNVRTGRATKLVRAPGGAHDLAWSPDGTRIAAHVDTGIALVDVSTRRMLTLTREGRHPLWSPDGMRIAFVRYDAEGDVARLLTIGRDGRGQRRVVAAMAGWTVSWSQDGLGLLFSKPRSAGEGADIWWIRVDGGGAKQVTRAFPTGASFSAPQWAATKIPLRTIAPMPAISLVPHTLLTTAPVVGLAADAGRVAFETTCSGGPLAIWDTAGAPGRVVGMHCDTEQGRRDLALAGSRTAWISDFYSMIASALVVARPGAKPADVDFADEKAYGELIGNLSGEGDLLVYNTWGTGGGTESHRIPVPTLWRVVGTTKKKLVSGAGALAAVDVDAGRIAVLRDDGTLVILDQQGNRLSAFPLGKKGLRHEWSTEQWPVRLTGRLVVALRGTTIEVRDASRGTPRHRWPTAPSEAPLTLEDARGNFAVYKAGIALHLLRLSDGRDRMLDIADAEGPVYAKFARNGLFYSYNTPIGAKHGRIAYIPLPELTSQFR